MGPFKFEQHPVMYFADFVLYPLVILGGAAVLAVHAGGSARVLLAAAVLGFLTWSFVEYTLHRFILHGLWPFKSWHETHHERPFALIGSSTPVSMTAFAVLVLWPVSAAAGPWIALAATLGMTAGYLLYVVVHHAAHHWRARPGSWMWVRKRCHALHHRPGASGWYGVTTSFWDRVFGTDDSGGEP
ncbi:MAG: sterol desaturase family protein [Castellaniella sp.]